MSRTDALPKRGRLHHRFDGPADGPLLILGPSLGTTVEVWKPQLPALTESWRVLRYDLPGHGGSAPWPDITIDDLARAVLDLTDARSFAYAGISVGGSIGTALAAAEPDRVSHLVLCCTAARIGTPAGWFERAELVTREGLEPLAAAAAARWFTPGFPDPGPYVAMLREADPEGYAAMCRAIGRFDARHVLGRITARTLVISGAQDPVTPPADAELLAAGVADAQLLVLDGASHLASVERAKEVTEAMLRHLGTR